MPDDLVILIPVLGRPHRVEPVLGSALEATPGARILFVASTYDAPMLAELERVGADFTAIGAREHGQYAKKINAGVTMTDNEWIFLAADDLRFEPGWFEAAKFASRETECLVVGTNDLGNSRVLSGDHSTHTLVHRDYVALGTIDDPTILLHEGYPHCFVDDEFIQTAIHRDQFVSSTSSIVEHLHPDWRKASYDPTYRIAHRSFNPGHRLFQQRKHLWGGGGRA